MQQISSANKVEEQELDSTAEVRQKHDELLFSQVTTKITYQNFEAKLLSSTEKNRKALLEKTICRKPKQGS